jgi:hypothetical protein
MAIGALAIALYKVIITYREYKIDSQKAVKQ